MSKSIFYACVWSELELSLGMMAASAPTLRVLALNYIERGSRLFSSSNRSSKSRTPNQSAHGMEMKGSKDPIASVTEKTNRSSNERAPSEDDLLPLSRPPGAGYTITPSISAHSVRDPYYMSQHEREVLVQQDVRVERQHLDV